MPVGLSCVSLGLCQKKLRPFGAFQACSCPEGAGASPTHIQSHPTIHSQVWSPAGYRVLVNSNNVTERRAAFQRAIAARETVSTGLTVVGSDWVARGITRVSTMLVTPLYWTPNPVVAWEDDEEEQEDDAGSDPSAAAVRAPTAAAAGAAGPDESMTTIPLPLSRVSAAADPDDPEAVLTGFLDINFAWSAVRRCS